MNKCIIIRSYPGSGKTTFANSMFPNVLKVENDQFFYHDGIYEHNKNRINDAITWCHDIVTLALTRRCDVVVSNTFTKLRYVKNYEELANFYGAKFEVYRMMGNFDNIHGLDEQTLCRFKDSMEDYEGEKFVYPVNNGYEILEERKQ